MMRFWPKKRWKQVLLIVFAILAIAIPSSLAYLSYANREPAFKVGASSSSFSVTSPAFADGQAIPVKYTAQGENINPPLNFEGIPQDTESLVVTVDDSMPFLTWNHWIIWNIPPTENITEDTLIGVQGRNGWNRNGYGGPDPISGVHIYVFTAYALDDNLSLSADVGKTALLRAMDNHVLAKAQLTGTYAK